MEDRDSNRLDEIRSDEVQEVISHVPSWMIRYGTTLIFVLVIMVLILSYIIKYPETIKGRVTITTARPSVELTCKTNGMIQFIHVQEGEYVEEGTRLLSIINPLNESAAQYLSDLTTKIDVDTMNNQLALHHFSNDTLTFGDLQSEFESLKTNVLKLNVLREDLYYRNQINNIQDQISNHLDLVKISLNQKKIMEETISDSREAYESDQALQIQGAISKREFNLRKQSYLRVENQLEEVNKSLIQAKISLSNYRKQLAELTFEFEEKQRLLKNNISSINKQIKNSLTTWEQNYTVVAPISGMVSFNDLFAKGSSIKAGNGLLSIVPKNKDYIGLISLPTYGAGKVDIGQKVHIKLENYPHHEFGELYAEVVEINKVSVEDQVSNSNNYMVKVKLSNGMVTSYKEELVYKPKLLGVAEIITKDLRLIDRLFYQMKKVMER